MKWAFLFALAAYAAEPPGRAAYERASALFGERKFAESLAAVDEALRLDPRFIPALTLKAKLAMAAQRFDVARSTLERALAVDPAAAYAQFLYGLQFYMANDLQHALPEFAKARKLNMADARAAQYLGLTTESLGRPLEALSLYEEATRLGPNADILLTGSRLLFLLNRLDECGQWIAKALRMDPQSRDAHFERARLLLKQGDNAGAAEEGEQALRLRGDAADGQIHYLLVRAYRDTSPADSERHAQAIR